MKDGLIGIHNGIITNVDELWEVNKDLKRQYDIDTEIMLSMLIKVAAVAVLGAPAVAVLIFEDRKQRQ